MTSMMGPSEVITSTRPKPDKHVCNIMGDVNESTIRIAGIECRVLIDTGSMISTISDKFYRDHLEADHPLIDVSSSINVEGAGGNQLKFLGVVEVELSSAGEKSELVVPMLVMPTTSYNKHTPAIIGTNVLSRIKDFSSFSGPLRDSAAVLQEVHGQEMDDVNLYSCGQVTLPPRKVTVITARIGAKRSYNYGVPTIVETLPGGLGIPQTLVGMDCDNMKVNMCLVNLTDHDVHIPKLQKIATVQSARAVEVHVSGSSADEVSDVEKTDHLGDSEEHASHRDVPVNLDDTDLTEEQKADVQELLRRYSDVFAFSKSELGTAKGVKHSIRLTDPTPFKDRPRRIPPALYKEVKDHIEEMLACGAIRRSKSPFCSNVVLARKHDGSLRLCLDFRRLNSRTIQDAYHIPRIEETLDRLAGAKWFSCLDLQAGYWQVEMAEEDREKTAFCVGSYPGSNVGNLFECNRMPFGLTNAPATFQRLMESQLGDLPFCQVYLDDIIIFSSTFEQQLERLEQTFQRLKSCGLKLKPSKCNLFRKRVRYLGHIISEDGVETDSQKIQCIQDWPLPTTVQELRRMLGFFGYYRRYIKGYSTIAKPLHDLMHGHENTSRSNKKTEITLTGDAKEAFLKLKQKLSEPPVLGYADYSLPFELHTDASLSGLGAVLYQTQNGKQRVIAYASRGLKPSETRYPAHKLEFLALKWAICDKFSDYLYGHQFEVLTDNNPLSYVLTTAKLDATGHRWLAELSTYNFSIKYRSGRLNIAADALSRIPRESVNAICNGIVTSEEDSISDIICYSQVVPSVSVSEAAGHLTPRDWRKLQQGDEVICRVTDGVKKHQKPSKELVSQYPVLKVYSRDWDKLFIKDELLYRKSKAATGEERLQLVLPTCKREEVLKGLHNDLGHMGRDRTTELVRERFYWPRLSDDVKNWIKMCEPCIKRKTSVPDRAELVNIKTTQPMELVCIDYLSLEPSKGGIENVLVMTDHFTRYAYAVPTRNQTAKVTAEALYKFFLHYGFPKYLHSDQGRNFMSSTIKELCTLAGITKTRTTPYHAMGNGMVERFNSTLLNMLGTLEEDKKKNWKEYVPAMVQAYNATRHDSTGYSPFFLMLGRHPRLPIDIVMGISPEEDKTETDYVRSLREKMQYAFDIATKNADKSAGHHKLNYDRRIRGGTVEIGDRVLVRNTGIRGKCKLANKWEDVPYTVMDQTDPNIPVFVVLQEGRRKVTRTLHRNMLLPINFLPLPDFSGVAGVKQKDTPLKKSVTARKEDEPEMTAVEEKEDDALKLTLELSDDESEDFIEIILNPLAEEFIPQQSTDIQSATSSASGEEEDPQVAELDLEVVEEDLGEDVVELLEADAVEEFPRVPANNFVENVVEAEFVDETVEPVDEPAVHSAVEDESVSEDELQSSSEDDDLPLQEHEDPGPEASPAVQRRSHRRRRPPDFYRPDEYVSKQHLASLKHEEIMYLMQTVNNLLHN